MIIMNKLQVIVNIATAKQILIRLVLYIQQITLHYFITDIMSRNVKYHPKSLLDVTNIFNLRNIRCKMVK